MDVHKAEAGEVGNVVGEREMSIKSNTKIADRGYFACISFPPTFTMMHLCITQMHVGGNLK